MSVIILLFLCIVVFFVYLYKKNKRIFAAIILLLTVICIAAVGISVCKESKGHMYQTNNETCYLPLPPRTKLDHRISDVSAVYSTINTIDGVEKFYKKLFGEIEIVYNKGKTEIIVNYNNDDFLIKFEEKFPKLYLDVRLKNDE